MIWRHLPATAWKRSKMTARGNTAFASMINGGSALSGRMATHTTLKSSITIKENSMSRKRTLAPVHPGEILREDLSEIGVSMNALAEALRVPANRILGIVRGDRAVTPETALRLAQYFGTSAEYWLNL